MSDVTQDGKIAAQKGNDVSVLDELRAALMDEFAPSVTWKSGTVRKRIGVVFKAFAAAHPGLVDANATYCVNEMFLEIPTGATVGKIEAHINGRHLVEVVRCVECVHGTMTETDHVWCRKNGHREQDDYCSYGQRKEATP